VIDKKYADYSWEKASALLNIDSPTGFTKKAAEFVKKEFSALGFPAEYTVKVAFLPTSAEKAITMLCFWRRTQIPSAEWSPKSRATAD